MDKDSGKPDAERFRAAVRGHEEAAAAGNDPQVVLTAQLMRALLPAAIDTLNAAKAQPPLAIPALAEALAYVAVSCIGQGAQPGAAGAMIESFIAAFAEEARGFACYIDDRHKGGSGP